MVADRLTRESLQRLPMLVRRREVKQFIRAALEEILGEEEVVAITRDTRIFDLGVGSLLIVQLRHRLEALIGDELPISLFMSHASLDQLASEVAERVDETRPDEPESTPDK